jgi:hypothetical protein
MISGFLLLEFIVNISSIVVRAFFYHSERQVHMTPYVYLQEQIIRVLRLMNERDTEFLKRIVAIYRAGGNLVYGDKQKIYEDYSFKFPTEPDLVREVGPIILELVDDTGPEIKIKNLLGMPLYKHYPESYGLDEFERYEGCGINRLRTPLFAQPGALKKGDVLVTGEQVISDPREGGNGAVLIHLSGGEHGTWLSLPARIPIAKRAN